MTPRFANARTAVLACLIACAGADQQRGGDSAGTGTDRRLVVYNAGSLAIPLRTALDSFAAIEKVAIEQENAGSLETARKLTELGKIPDIVAVADYEVIPLLLIPDHATWYAKFAHNRMVLAYHDKSRFASEITTDNWWQIVTRPDVQLAERFYKQPGLGQRMLTAAPERNVRPKEADLVGLLQAGEFDYIWSYESIALAVGLRYVTLPTAIDLSSPTDSAAYAAASVRVAGKTPRDSITMRGQPIVYAFTVPTRAPHPTLAMRFAIYLASPDGRRVLRGAKLDAFDSYTVVGTGAPPLQ